MNNRNHPFNTVSSANLMMLGILTCLLVVCRTQAATLFATANNGYSEIDQVNTITNSVTTYLNTPAPPDSIIFDTSGNPIYSTVGAGQVIKYNPITTTSTVLASGLTDAADEVLEPGGNSMLVSDYGAGTIDRINLSPISVTTLSTGLGNPEGLAYDGSKLFANIGYRYGGPTAKQVAQIDPVTGAILATSPGLNSLDGLTYDPYSGLLYAASLFGNLIYSIDPNNLSIVQVATGTQIVPGPDGITTDGAGNLFIASSSSVGNGHVYQFNLNTNTLTQDTHVNGLDDLAPASGAGSVPEPSSLSLLTLGGAGILRRRRGPSAKSSAV
ncbi:MAG: PEP-CTERM sorting domain-containing protein [Tepidisphaeraceae bacterium]